MRRALKTPGFKTQQMVRNEVLAFSVLLGHSSPSILEKSCGTLALKRDSSGNSNLTNGVNCSRNTVSSRMEPGEQQLDKCRVWDNCSRNTVVIMSDTPLSFAH